MKARVAAIILAAGQNRRFGTDADAKVLAPFHGVPLVRVVAMTALRSCVVSATVVTGLAHEDVADALGGLDVRFVRNGDFADGMAGSLKAGLANSPPDVDGVIVMLADMPLVRAETLDHLVAHFDACAAKPHAIIPVHDARRGNPVLVGRRLFAGVRSLHGDEGARALLQRPDVVVELCAVDDPGILIDVDTLAGLEALNRGA